MGRCPESAGYTTSASPTEPHPREMTDPSPVVARVGTPDAIDVVNRPVSLVDRVSQCPLQTTT